MWPFRKAACARRQARRHCWKKALKLGVETIGGLDPAAFDSDVEGQLDLVFDLAVRYRAGIDIHLHDGGELGIFELGKIAERYRAHGLAEQVAVSHAYALGMVAESDAAAMAYQLARAGVAIMTSASSFGAMPPVKLLLDCGVVVLAGSDNIRNALSPFGNGDML